MFTEFYCAEMTTLPCRFLGAFAPQWAESREGMIEEEIVAYYKEMHAKLSTKVARVDSEQEFILPEAQSRHEHGSTKCFYAGRRPKFSNHILMEDEKDWSHYSITVKARLRAPSILFLERYRWEPVDGSDPKRFMNLTLYVCATDQQIVDASRYMYTDKYEADSKIHARRVGLRSHKRQRHFAERQILAVKKHEFTHEQAANIVKEATPTYALLAVQVADLLAKDLRAKAADHPQTKFRLEDIYYFGRLLVRAIDPHEGGKRMLTLLGLTAPKISSPPLDKVLRGAFQVMRYRQYNADSATPA